MSLNYLNSKIKILLILIILLIGITIQCSDQFSIDDKDTLRPSEGILCMNIKYLEGHPTFSTINFTIENLDRSFFFKIELSSNTGTSIFYRLKAGKYYFSDIKGELEEARIPQQGKEGKSHNLFGSVYENVFEIEPGKINYIGDILFQTKRQQVGNYSVLSDDNSGIKETLYFFSIHNPKTIDQTKLKYSNLASKYNIKKQQIILGKDSLAIKELIKHQYETGGYGENTYGIDTEGYGDYKWGMTSDEVKIIMNSKKKIYRQIEKNLIVDTSSKSSKIHFYFSHLPIALWKGRLYKVSIDLKKKTSQILQQLKLKYGNPKKEKNKWIWEIPSTFIILEKSASKKSLLSYISKSHLSHLK
ncbi:MAG: hypothetical protein OEV44_05505 [Spirochaetota bacterium]|nr:hypothetical protein [Spirochaetota bacterium]